MLDSEYEIRAAATQNAYLNGLRRVHETPEPINQKFPCGSRVKIVDDLGESMKHFVAGIEATVEYVYAHAYGGTDVKSYSLNIDGEGSVAWYKEDQLSLVEEPK